MSGLGFARTKANDEVAPCSTLYQSCFAALDTLDQNPRRLIVVISPRPVGPTGIVPSGSPRV